MTASPDLATARFADTAMDTLETALDTGISTSLDISHDDSALHGMPSDREARIAARRAFVSMKLLFMRAVQALDDRKGQWLRYQVRLASDPIDLWLLRGPVLSAVQHDDARSRQLRAELYRGLDSIFPDSFGMSAEATRPAPLPEGWDMRALPTSLPTGPFSG